MLSIRIQTVSVSKLEELVKCKLVHKLKVTHDVELVHSGYKRQLFPRKRK